MFQFVTDGIHAALQQARDAADGRDVRLGGGVATGTGEDLLTGVDVRTLGYEWMEHLAGARAAAHVLPRKRA